MREQLIELGDHPIMDAQAHMFDFGAFERVEDFDFRRAVEDLIRHGPQTVVFLLDVAAEQRRVRGGLQRERRRIVLLDRFDHAGDGGATFDVFMSHDDRGSESGDASFERGEEDLLLLPVVAGVRERAQEIEEIAGGGEIEAVAFPSGRGQMIEDFERSFDQAMFGAKNVGRLRGGGVASHGNLPSARRRV